MNSGNATLNVTLGLMGAALGGVLGYFAFLWIAQQGLYAVALPGALLGLGCGLLVRRRSLPLAIACGVLALGLGVFSHWRAFPFVVDDSLGFLLTHLHRLRPIQLIMLTLGGVFGFWFALGSKGKRL